MSDTSLALLGELSPAANADLVPAAKSAPAASEGSRSRSSSHHSIASADVKRIQETPTATGMLRSFYIIYYISISSTVFLYSRLYFYI